MLQFTYAKLGDGVDSVKLVSACARMRVCVCVCVCMHPGQCVRACVYVHPGPQLWCMGGLGRWRRAQCTARIGLPRRTRARLVVRAGIGSSHDQEHGLTNRFVVSLCAA